MLTVPEEFVLLTAGGPEETAKAPGVDLADDRLGIRFAMTGAALMELALRDRIETDIDQLWVRDTSETGEAAVDPVLARLTELANPSGEPKPIVDTIRALDDINSCRLALASLSARGVVRDSVERVLGLVPIKTQVVAERDVMRAVRKRIHDVLFAGEIPDPRDACLISLVDATKKFRSLVPEDRVADAIAQTRRYSSLDLVGRNVAIQVTAMINSFSKYGGIV